MQKRAVLQGAFGPIMRWFEQAQANRRWDKSQHSLEASMELKPSSVQSS